MDQFIKTKELKESSENKGQGLEIQGDKRQLIKRIRNSPVRVPTTVMANIRYQLQYGTYSMDIVST